MCDLKDELCNTQVPGSFCSLMTGAAGAADVEVGMEVEMEVDVEVGMEGEMEVEMDIQESTTTTTTKKPKKKKTTTAATTTTTSSTTTTTKKPKKKKTTTTMATTMSQLNIYTPQPVLKSKADNLAALDCLGVSLMFLSLLVSYNALYL